MKAIKNYDSFKKSLLASTNGTMVESFDSSNIFNDGEYQSYRVYVDDVHYYNMFVIHNFSSNSYDVSLETSNCAVSTMSRVVKTQKAMIESVCGWCYYSYLNAKEISVDSEEYTDRCEETENAECSRGNDVFDGYKTVKDVLEVKQELNARFGKEQYFDTDTLQSKIENINHCPNQNTCCIVHCDYNYKSDACIKAHKNSIHHCEQVHKHMKAINNPNWHTVKLAIVNSNDFVRLNEKLKLYISTYRELKQTLSYLRKCKTINTYDSCYLRYIRKQNDMRAKSKFTDSMLNYIRAKLSMQNVESGVWSSDCEPATGFHESRRYNKSRIDL